MKFFLIILSLLLISSVSAVVYEEAIICNQNRGSSAHTEPVPVMPALYINYTKPAFIKGATYMIGDSNSQYVITADCYSEPVLSLKMSGSTYYSEIRS